MLANVFCPAGHRQAIGMKKLRVISEGIANRLLELGSVTIGLKVNCEMSVRSVLRLARAVAFWGQTLRFHSDG